MYQGKYAICRFGSFPYCMSSGAMTLKSLCHFFYCKAMQINPAVFSVTNVFVATYILALQTSELDAIKS